MKPEETNSENRLDQVVTQWSLLRIAHSPQATAGPQARQELLLRYRGAIRSYVAALLLNETEADDVAQDVLVRLMRGDFASADPTRGRFRDFLKVAVKNMVRNHWERKQRHVGVSLAANPELEQAADTGNTDEQWTDQWRSQLLESTWQALEQFQRETQGCVYFTALKLRSEYPQEDSTRVAERMAETTGKPWRPDAYRQQLRRARLRFAQLLIEELSHSLIRPTPDNVEQELIELGLMEFVRPFLPEDWLQTGELREMISK
jgi:RNA polymerase sigma factor (sigma-70 family)